jgi:hypothetical protein
MSLERHFVMVPSFNFPLGVSRHDPYFEKILRIIESFRGYETLDDLKAADEQVRKYLAQQLRMAAVESAGARKTIESGLHLRVLPGFDAMARHIQADSGLLQEDIKYRIAACQAYKPEADPIRELYMLDYKLLTSAENVYNLMQEFVRISREDLMIANIHKIDLSLRDIEECMEKGGRTIDCMLR